MIILAYFYFIGIQTISTEKKSYSIGEPIKIDYSNYQIKYCNCINEYKIFKKEQSGWSKILTHIEEDGCIDNQMDIAHKCDVLGCSYNKFISLYFAWNQRVYEKTGTTNSCLSESVAYEFNNIPTYHLRNASIGIYKITYGSAQTIIEIK